jgi:hypothetical protein
MRRNLFYAALLAAIVSAPLAGAIVLADWTWMEHEVGASMSGALWAGRAFTAWFDVLVLITWLPCAAWVSRRLGRVAPQAIPDAARVPGRVA